MNRLLSGGCLAACLVFSTSAGAVLTELVIETTVPHDGGTAFGDVGAYEELRGYAIGELDPADPGNAGIVNLDRAPLNANGRVEYRVDVEIWRPVDLARGNGWMLYEVVNRGNKLAPFFVNGVTDFLFEEGYTLVWSGWQGDIASGGSRVGTVFPVATDNGATIVGLSRDEFIVSSNASPFDATLSYPAASLDPNLATLTVRENEKDPRQTPAGLAFEYLSDTQIRITRPVSPEFDGGAIYEFIYPARDPIVMGIGLAATRDVNSFLRYEKADSAGNENPLAGLAGRRHGRHGEDDDDGGDRKGHGREDDDDDDDDDDDKPRHAPDGARAFAIGISQSGRFLRDLIYQGFNEDEAGRQVFEGAIPVIAGSRKTFTNFEFAQPGRFSRQHEDHLYPGDQFPFTYGTLTDPVTGVRDGILKRCRESHTCPKVMHFDSETEIWQARGSLVVTDGDPVRPRDIKLPRDVRAYLMAGTQHGPAGTPSFGICQQLSNPLNYRPILRAIIDGMREWLATGRKPPKSNYGSVRKGTLITPLQSVAEFPAIPGVFFNGLVNGLTVNDHSVLPPLEGDAYPVLVPLVDADGNSVAGVQHPNLQAPVATHGGWNLRAAGQAENELCSLTGSYIPFAATKAERIASGDPRPSIAERYKRAKSYVQRVRRAAQMLEGQRLLLPADADAIVEEAKASGIGG